MNQMFIRSYVVEYNADLSLLTEGASQYGSNIFLQTCNDSEINISEKLFSHSEQIDLDQAKSTAGYSSEIPMTMKTWKIKYVIFLFRELQKPLVKSL